MHVETVSSLKGSLDNGTSERPRDPELDWVNCTSCSKPTRASRLLGNFHRFQLQQDWATPGFLRPGHSLHSSRRPPTWQINLGPSRRVVRFRVRRLYRSTHHRAEPPMTMAAARQFPILAACSPEGHEARPMNPQCGRGRRKGSATRHERSRPSPVFLSQLCARPHKRTSPGRPRTQLDLLCT
jgi:hypothetical protein